MENAFQLHAFRQKHLATLNFYLLVAWLAQCLVHKDLNGVYVIYRWIGKVSNQFNNILYPANVQLLNNRFY